jgi:hypothetical protein
MSELNRQKTFSDETLSKSIQAELKLRLASSQFALCYDRRDEHDVGNNSAREMKTSKRHQQRIYTLADEKRDTMNKLFVQAPCEKIACDFIDFARDNHHGIGLTSFAFPSTLNGDLKTTVRSYITALKGFENEVSIHGVFMDIITASIDTKMVSVARERVLLDVEIAKQLRAKIVTFCSCFNPCIARSTPSYTNGYTERQVEFWSEMSHSMPIATSRWFSKIYGNLSLRS